jgi:hypothetical protein
MVDISNLSKYADILAIPFFLLLSIYFYNKKNKTPLEHVFLLFSVAGLVLDTIFTFIFLG